LRGKCTRGYPMPSTSRPKKEPLPHGTVEGLALSLWLSDDPSGIWGRYAFVDRCVCRTGVGRLRTGSWARVSGLYFSISKTGRPRLGSAMLRLIKKGALSNRCCGSYTRPCDGLAQHDLDREPRFCGGQRSRSSSLVSVVATICRRSIPLSCKLPYGLTIRAQTCPINRLVRYRSSPAFAGPFAE